MLRKYKGEEDKDKYSWWATRWKIRFILICRKQLKIWAFGEQSEETVVNLLNEQITEDRAMLSVDFSRTVQHENEN